jgi:hypothetical protein
VSSLICKVALVLGPVTLDAGLGEAASGSRKEVSDRPERRTWEGMRFLAFDSFCGLPDTVRLESKSPELVESRIAAEEKEVVNNLKSYSVDILNVVIVT